MTKPSMTSRLATALSEMAKHKRARFALLAMVGVRKREASRLQEEMELYYISATELAAVSTELVMFLRQVERTNPQVSPLVAESMSLVHRSIKRLLNSSPQSSESMERLVTLLNSDGLATMMGTTANGYVTLSSDLIIENVARVIEVTKAQNQKVSFISGVKKLLASAGTSGGAQAVA